MQHYYHFECEFIDSFSEKSVKYFPWWWVWLFFSPNLEFSMLIARF